MVAWLCGMSRRRFPQTHLEVLFQAHPGTASQLSRAGLLPHITEDIVQPPGVRSEAAHRGKPGVSIVRFGRRISVGIQIVAGFEKRMIGEIGVSGSVGYLPKVAFPSGTGASGILPLSR